MVSAMYRKFKNDIEDYERQQLIEESRHSEIMEELRKNNELQKEANKIYEKELDILQREEYRRRYRRF